LVSNPWENIDTFKLVQSDSKSANYFPKKSCFRICKAKLLFKKLFVLFFNKKKLCGGPLQAWPHVVKEYLKTTAEINGSN
jgi:hypothetical protein